MTVCDDMYLTDSPKHRQRYYNSPRSRRKVVATAIGLRKYNGEGTEEQRSVNNSGLEY